MGNIQKQVMNFRAMKGVTAAQSREHQRNWSERGWNAALSKGNYDRCREHLNFEIVKGGKIQPIDKTKDMPQRMAESLTAHGIKDPNEGLAEPSFRTVVDFVFSGSHERMCEMAFGNQPVVIEPGENESNLHIHREPAIEQWAKDIYDFVAAQFGEENIIGFFVHNDETTPHCHATIVPVKDGKISFKKVFHGENKIDFAKNTARLHDELAKVNEPWGLVRGSSLTDGKVRHKQSQDYRRETENAVIQKERELADVSSSLEKAYRDLALAERRVKGLNSMIEHLRNSKRLKEAEIAEINRHIKNRNGDEELLKRQRAEVEKELEKVQEQLADKTEKLETAKQQLVDTKLEVDTKEAQRETLEKQSHALADIIQSDTGILFREAMLDAVVGDYREQMAALPKGEPSPFAGSTLEWLAENGNEVLYCASMLMLNMVDEATSFAKDSGGGGTSSDLKWGRDDDDDDRMWARRCLHQAMRMMRPRTKSRKR